MVDVTFTRTIMNPMVVVEVNTWTTSSCVNVFVTIGVTVRIVVVAVVCPAEKKLAADTT